MEKTPNLGLPLALHGHVPLKQSVEEAFIKIDAAFGGDLPSGADLSAIDPIATADATDEPTTMALVNEIKATLNALIAALKA